MLSKEFWEFFCERYKLIGEDIVGPSGKALKGRFNPDGYRSFTVKFEGRYRTVIYARGKYTLAHGYIPPQLQLEHKNQVRSDDRFANLRLATASQNSANRKRVRKDYYKGVTKSKNRYRARCRDRHLGSFLTAAEAALAYDKEARAVYGSFACVNFPKPGEIGAF